MQKKLLASLLVAPMAFSALADINIDIEGASWKSSGLVGEDGFQVNGDLVTAQVGVGQLTQTLNLPAGNYKLTFGSTSNLSVSLKGCSEVSSSNHVYDFEVAKEGSVTITIEAEDASKAFSFSGAKLVLVFDSESANAALTEKLKGVFTPLGQVAADDDSADAKLLREQYAGYHKSYDEISAKIAEITEDMTIAQYKELELSNYPDSDVIDSAIDTLEETIEADNYVANLAAYNAYVSNMASYNNVAEAVKVVKDKLTKVTADKDAALEGKSEEYKTYVEGATAAESSAATEAVNAYNSAAEAYLANIKTAYEDLSTEAIGFDPEDPEVASKAETAVDEYEASVNAAIADMNAYDEVKAAVDGLATVRDEQLTIVMSTVGVVGYENYLVNASNQCKEEISKACAEGEKAMLSEIQGASEAKKAALAVVAEATAKMKSLAEDFSANVKANNAALEDYLGELNPI